MKLGAARDQSRSAWRLAVIEVAADSAAFSYRLDRNKLRQARSREGRYLLRTNLVEEDPAKLWNHYLLLVAVEEAFKNLKGDLAIRPIFHQLEARVEAHVFIAFLAYCLHVTLARRLHALAPGLTPHWHGCATFNIALPRTAARRGATHRHAARRYPRAQIWTLSHCAWKPAKRPVMVWNRSRTHRDGPIFGAALASMNRTWSAIDRTSRRSHPRNVD